MQSEEEYLGGFYSEYLKRGKWRGYGVYATNQRIIGLKSAFDLRGAPDGSVLGSAPEVVLVTTKSRWKINPQERKLTKDEGDKIIAWLDEKKKDFELSKSQVSQIEIKNIGLFRAGYLRITPTIGEEVKVWISSRMDFELVKNLMQAFLPEAVKFID